MERELSQITMNDVTCVLIMFCKASLYIYVNTCVSIALICGPYTCKQFVKLWQIAWRLLPTVQACCPSLKFTVPPRFWLYMIVTTWLCPDTFVPRSCPWIIIIIVFTRLCVNLIGENTSMLNCWRSEVKCDYFTTVQQSPAVFLLA